jgi:hypothetical protein
VIDEIDNVVDFFIRLAGENIGLRQLPQIVGQPFKEVVDRAAQQLHLLEVIGRRPRAARKADFLLAQFGLDHIAREVAARAP